MDYSCAECLLQTAPTYPKKEKLVKTKRKCSYTMIIALAITLTGCATWSTSSVDRNTNNATVAVQPTTPEKIQLSDGDMADRKYLSLGDITATVNKTTIFHPEPTKELVNVKLREKAAEQGADAVILIRYGNGGVSLMSWGSLEGKGRAIKFQQ